MDKLAQYRAYVQEVLQKYTSYPSTDPQIEKQLLCDTQHDHYQLLYLGWIDNRHHEFSCLAHVDIKDSKIWIQWDTTEAGIANKLVELGVPKQDIVLAFQPPYKRPLTEFAVG